MHPSQEEILYEFLENETGPFTLEDITAYVQMSEAKRDSRLALEIAALIDSRNIAFRLDNRQWLSRRGCFEPLAFVITPSRQELLNGILIPGHRCVPFANPVLLPQDLQFYWKGAQVPATTSEGPPEDFYPYYCIFGEEYAPQYVARDNPDNEAAFNSDRFEDPPEVSIRTLDARNLYRETGFVPGDRFVVRSKDWKAGHFTLEKVTKDEWDQTDLYHWFEAAEGGFADSFALLGPGTSTEEQIAYAYWYGGKRMRELPAYSLEEFLYEKTSRIDTVPFGIETRFWFADKEIPDTGALSTFGSPPDRTVIENLLYRKNIPVSEYVILSYIRDALFRNETGLDQIINRLAPPPAIPLEKLEWDLLADYITRAMEEIEDEYSLFVDRSMGPTRQRLGELHTAIIELAAKLQKSGIDPAWLPKHTFIILSQVQGHTAGLLEDMDTNEALPDSDMEAIENSLDSMIETFEDIKELINTSLHNFRRSNLMIVRDDKEAANEATWRIVQLSVSGIDVWRRVLVPGASTLEDLRRLLQLCLDWESQSTTRFSIPAGNPGPPPEKLDPAVSIHKLCEQHINEISCQYNLNWTVNILLLSPYRADREETIRCVAGAGVAPPLNVAGPRRFRFLTTALTNGSDIERQAALHELGQTFVPGLFDREECNRRISEHYPGESPTPPNGA
jgi:hypothetical protein